MGSADMLALMKSNSSGQMMLICYVMEKEHGNRMRSLRLPVAVLIYKGMKLRGEDYLPWMAATPGSTLPSIASRSAPPPVDT